MSDLIEDVINMLPILSDDERGRMLNVLLPPVEPGEIMSFSGRRTNAEAIRDAAVLGYIKADRPTIDVTYGYGKFWTLWEPNADVFLRGDLNPAKSPDFPDGLDATNTGLESGRFHSTIIDAAYQLNGTSTGAGPSAKDEAYGVEGEYRPVKQVHQLMEDMLVEGHRITERGGHILFKCQAQNNAGRVRWQDRMFADFAERELGMWHVGTLFVEGWRAQPREQRTARMNYSSLLILQRKKKVS